MHPLSWPVPLWALLVSLLAAAQARATGREARQGTVLVAGQPVGAPSVLYVAARFSTLVDFEDLLEPRALLTPELIERLGVVPVGPRSLAIVPLRDLAEGERLLVQVTGRTGTGESRTLTLALVTRRDEVDQQVRVILVSREPPQTDTENEVAAVARMLLASHEPGNPPSLALITPSESETRVQADDVQGWIEFILQMNRRRLFITVTAKATTRSSLPWRLARVRVEAGCRGVRAGTEVPLPVLITSAVPVSQVQRHTIATRLPEGVRCLSLTMEEDGPRTLHFQDVRLLP